MGKVVNRFEKMMVVSLVMSLLDIVVGVLFLKYTNFSTKINLVLLGSLILINGLFFLIRYIYDGLGNKFFAIDLVCGVSSIILGIFVLFSPFGALQVIGIIFFLWLCILAVEKFYYAYRFMKNNESIYPLTGFIGILMVVMGLLSLVNPFQSIIRLLGIFLLCAGLFEAMICNLFRQRAKNILALFK